MADTNQDKGFIEAAAPPKGIVGRILVGFAKGILHNAIVKPLTTFLSVVFMWTFHAIMRLSDPEGKRLIKTIADTYYTPPDEWIEWVAEYIRNMTGKEIPTSELKGLRTTAVATEAMKKFSRTIMDRILNLIVPEGPITEEDGLQAAADYLSVNMQFQMGSWLLHLLGDMVSFGMFKSLKDLPNAISWSFGLGWLSWLVMGTPFQESIITPLRWKYRDQLRPARFSPKEATDLYKRGLIDAKTWNYLLQIEGWREEDKKLFYELQEKDFSDSMLREALEAGWMSEDEVLEELRHKGFSKSRAKAVLNYWKYKRYRDRMEDVLKEYIDLYKDDKVEKREIEVLVRQLYPDKTEQELILDMIDAQKTKAKSLTMSNIREALRKGVIGVAQARNRLLGMGYSPEDADILLRTWQA